jgi:F0F1-type ATP synthase membrane subunit b/b'
MEVIVLVGIVLMLVVVVVAQSFQLRRLGDDKKRQTALPPVVKVSQPTADELDAKLKAAYEAKITEATGTFGDDLRATSQKLSEQVSRLTTTVIEEELDGYQKTLEEVRKAATQAMDQIHQAVEHQRVELRQGMEAELAAEKKLLADKFDAKMGDVVASYISESLGSGVDLGSQMQFILTSLEKHKEDIRKDLLGGV